MLRTPSKGSRFANQSCSNSGHPDYFRGLLWNTQQVWPPGAPRDSAAPQPRQKQLVAQARVGLRTLLGPPGHAGDPVTAGSCRFRGSPAGKCLPPPPHLRGGPAVEESTKERTIEKEKGTPRRAPAGAEGGGWAGGGKEREPHGARGDTPGKRRSGD